MIEKLTLENFLSFKERIEFDFTATQERPKKGYEHIHWFEDINKKKILKALFLFGNNGTGKSNFLSAISILSGIICTKSLSKTSEESKMPETFFKLSSDTIGKPSNISIVFHTCDIRYTYDIAWQNNVIIKESLLKQEGARKSIEIFNRSFDEKKDIVTVDFSRKGFNQEAKSTIRNNVIKNSSVISIYDDKNFENEDIKNVYKYFDNIGIFFRLDSIDLPSMLENRKNKEHLKSIIIPLLKDLGSNIIDYNVETVESKISETEALFLKLLLGEEEVQKRYPNGLKKIQSLRFAHLTDAANETAWLRETEESLGTLNMIRLMIVFYDACRLRSPIIIDECAYGIHQQTFGRILQFFLSTSTHAQAFMASQNLSLMDMEGFRRDTLKFFDKDRRTGVSSCTKIDLHKYHKNLNILKVYLDNSFGSLPEFPTSEEWKERLLQYKEILNS